MRKGLCLMLALLLIGSFAAAETRCIVRSGSREEKRVCITVDDCRDIDCLKEMFELSLREEAPMTFFTLGYPLKEEDGDLWRAIAESHCEIGNHSYGHPELPQLSVGEIRNELKKCQQALDEVLGYHYPMQVMRPPYGKITKNGSSYNIKTAAQREGYAHVVLWDVSQTDPVKCLPKVKNGSILLFHTLQKDLECLKVLIPQLREEGYEFVTVSEMFGLPPVKSQPPVSP